MTQPNDSQLTPEQLKVVVRHADQFLRDAAAIGVYPTPIERLLAAAKLTVVEDELLDETFLAQFQRMAKSSLDSVRSALGKVLGMLHVPGRMILLDLRIPLPKKPFVKLHEAGHHSLPHQNKLYAFIHDSEKTLEPDVTELFEREANVFASEVLFQGTGFSNEAHQFDFGIKVPLDLATKYGASKYATFRRYVDSSPCACCVLVLEPAVLGADSTFTAEIRRTVVSKTFGTMYDATDFGTHLSDRHILGHIVPLKRRMTGRRSIALRDRNGSRRQCTAEAFNSTHQIFILIRDTGPAPTIVLAPGGYLGRHRV